MPDRNKKILFAIIAISVLLRVAAALYLGNTVVDLPGTADQVSYHNLALRVAAGYGFTFGKAWWPATAANAPTAHWSYLYTGYLVLIYSLFGSSPIIARLIQAILVGILQPYLAYLLGRHLFGGVVGLMAALLVAVYTYFIYYAATLMTESFYITAVMASLYFSMRLVNSSSSISQPKQVGTEKTSQAGDKQSGTLWGWALVLGLTLGAAVLLRQLFLLFIPFLFIWILFSGWRQIKPLILSTAIIILMILPFTIFNYARFHRFVLVNTNAGFAFFWGNNPIYGTHFVDILPPEMGTYQSLIPEELRSLDEAALDQALLKRGIGFVLQDPKRYILLSLSRFPSYFKFWPSSGSGMVSNLARVTSFGILWPFMLYGLILSFFRKPSPFRLKPPSPLFLCYLFVFIYSAIHILTWTLIRYRLPVDAILLLFAGFGVVDLLGRIPALQLRIKSLEA